MSLNVLVKVCCPTEARNSQVNPYPSVLFTNRSSTTGACQRSRIRYSQWLHFSRWFPYSSPGRGLRHHEIIHDGSLDPPIPFDCCRRRCEAHSEPLFYQTSECRGKEAGIDRRAQVIHGSSGQFVINGYERTSRSIERAAHHALSGFV